MSITSGTITGSGQTITLSDVSENNAVAVTVKGTYTDVELFFEVTNNGTDWFLVALVRSDTATLTSSTNILTDIQRAWATKLEGTLVDSFRVRSVAHTSGTMDVTIAASVTDVIGDPLSGEAWVGQDVTANSFPVTMASDQPPIDVEVIPSGGGSSASGRLRTAEPVTIFDHYFIHDDGSLFWDTDLSGAGTVTRNSTQGLMDLAVGTASGDRATHQTKPYFPHQAGKSHQVLLTGVMGVLKTNVRQRVGYFDNDNGLFFEQDGTNLKVVRRTNTSGSPVDNAVNQASWNLDTMDGAGPSGVTIDMSKNQLFAIDFEWLGAGRVRMGFQISGTVIYFHEFLTANTLSLPYMRTPTLPVRYEIENTGTAASGTTMKQVCCTVISEGGWNPLGVIRCVDTGTEKVSISSGVEPVVSVRLKSANNRAIIKPLGISGGSVGGSEVVWRLIVGGSLSGASWSDVSSTAFSEFDIDANSISGGEVIACGHAGSDQAAFTLSIESSLWVVSDFGGTSDILTLAIGEIGGSSTDVIGSIQYKEFL